MHQQVSEATGLPGRPWPWTETAWNPGLATRKLCDSGGLTPSLLLFPTWRARGHCLLSTLVVSLPALGVLLQVAPFSEHLRCVLLGDSREQGESLWPPGLEVVHLTAPGVH